MTAVCLKEQKAGQEEAADACVGPPFQRRISHQASAREACLSGPEREVCGRGVREPSVAREVCGSESACDRRCETGRAAACGFRLWLEKAEEGKVKQRHNEEGTRPSLISK